MHTTYNNLYFCTVKIQKINHIYVQKNIKVVEFVENLHCQNRVSPLGVKASWLNA